MTAAPSPPSTPRAGAAFVPLSVPEVRGNEWRYIKECLDTGWVSSAGAYVERFECDVAAAAGTRHGIATASGTAALHVALQVAGVAPGDEVLVSALTFIAPANAVRYAGAWPVFIDAEPGHWQMDPELAVDFLTRGCDWREGALWNRATGRRVSALLPVHILGHPVDLDDLLPVARDRGLAVVEDATESLGATYRGRAVGHLGDIACFSFNGNKLITTGGGGMIVTDQEAWARRARHLTTQAKEDPVEYVHDEIGYNYRLTNLQAAMGVAQMEQLADFLAAKRAIAERYAAAFAGVPGLRPLREAEWARSAWWMYAMQVDEQEFGIGSRALMLALEDRGIQTRPLWQPLHRSPAHATAPRMECPVADRLNREVLNLPCSVGLAPAAQDRVIETVLHLGRGSR